MTIVLEQRSQQPDRDSVLTPRRSCRPASRRIPVIRFRTIILRGAEFLPAGRALRQNLHGSAKGTSLELFFQAFDLTNHANFGNRYGSNIRTSTFEQPTAFVTASGVIVPKSFAGEFGARFSF